MKRISLTRLRFASGIISILIDGKYLNYKLFDLLKIIQSNGHVFDQQTIFMTH